MVLGGWFSVLETILNNQGLDSCFCVDDVVLLTGLSRRAVVSNLYRLESRGYVAKVFKGKKLYYTLRGEEIDKFMAIFFSK